MGGRCPRCVRVLRVGRPPRVPATSSSVFPKGAIVSITLRQLPGHPSYLRAVVPHSTTRAVRGSLHHSRCAPCPHRADALHCVQPPSPQSSRLLPHAPSSIGLLTPLSLPGKPLINAHLQCHLICTAVVTVYSGPVMSSRSPAPAKGGIGNASGRHLKPLTRLTIVWSVREDRRYILSDGKVICGGEA